MKNLCDKNGVEFVSIQEHFKNNKTTDKYFRAKFSSFDSHIDIHTHGVRQSTIHVKYVIYDIFDMYDIHDIWHMTLTNMSIWVSKEALGPQECSQPPYIFYNKKC